MGLKEIKQNLKGYAVTNLKKGIQTLINSLDDQSPLQKDGLNLLGQYNRVTRERSLDLIPPNEADLRLNKILNAFLHTVDSITSEDLEGLINNAHNDANNLSELERNSLNSQATLILRKLDKLKQANITATDAAVKFNYELQIEELEKQLKEIKKKLKG